MSDKPLLERIHSIAAFNEADLTENNQKARARPWHLVVAVISWTNYITYTGRLRWGRYLAYAGLLSAVLGLVGGAEIDWKFYAVVVAGPLLGLITVVLEVKKWKGEENKLSISPPNFFDRDDYAAVVGTETLLQVRTSFVAYDPETCQAIRRLETLPDDDQPRVRWDKRSRPLSDALEEDKAEILLHSYRSARKLRPYNGRVASQRSDITPDTLARHDPVVMSETRYFDLMCTNYLGDREVTYGRGASSPRYRGIDLISSDEGGTKHLQSLRYSLLANVVGVSTLTIDTDGNVILISQSRDALSSGALLAPSGSGSLEERDYRTAEEKSRPHPPTLVEVIRAGMNRELVEEANIRPEWIGWSQVLGYYRWLDKGAKPEYVGVTLLRCGTDDVARSVRFDERRWVKEIIPRIELDIERLIRDPDNPGAALRSEQTADLTRRLSVPLHMCLRMLGDELRAESGDERGSGRGEKRGDEPASAGPAKERRPLLSRLRHVRSLR